MRLISFNKASVKTNEYEEILFLKTAGWHSCLLKLLDSLIRDFNVDSSISLVLPCLSECLEVLGRLDPALVLYDVSHISHENVIVVTI